MKEEPSKKRIRGWPRGSYLVAAALLFLLAGVLTGTRLKEGASFHKEARKFEKTLHKKEQLLKSELSHLEALFSGDPPDEVLDGKSEYLQKLAIRQGITIFYYERDILKYWSDHTIPIPNRWRTRFARPYVSLRNADYVSVVHKVGDGRLMGFIEIRTHFPIHNKFLINEYQKDFALDPGVGIRILEANGSESIYNDDGTYLFTLDFSESKPVAGGVKILAISFILLFIILAFSGISRIVQESAGVLRKVWIGLATLLVGGGAMAIIKYGFPSLLTSSLLFQPELYANRIFPSLGALLVLSMALLSLVSLYYLYGNLETIRSPRGRKVVAFLLFAWATVILLFIEFLVSTLVLDSGISFESHRVTTLTGYTVVGLLIIIMWFIMLGLLLDKAITLSSGSAVQILLIGSIAISVTFVAAALLPGHYGSWISRGGMLLLVAGQLYLRVPEKKITFSRFIFLLLFISVFMVIRLQHYNHVKVEQKKRVELVKLSSEHDPVAEMLFSEMSMAIRNDSVFAEYLDQPYIDIDQVIDRLKRNYFSGYWSKYDLQITVCRPDDRVYLQPPDDEWVHCYTFFDEMILESGIAIGSSDFYFLDNLNGRISYLASIPYFRSETEHRVFIELDSKILSEELGYPELLLDDTYRSFTSTDFSYAKYNNGELITQDGAFPYRRLSSFYSSGAAMFEEVTVEGFDHSVYNVDAHNTIIAGSPSVTLVDTLISFSYIFALNFLLLALAYLLVKLRSLKPLFNWSFKNRIQYSMVGLLFLTVMLICSGTIYFIIQQYKVKHNDNLRNTMRSVYIELIHKVEYEDDLVNWSSADYYNLDELLVKFSNVFYTDINLYDQEGNLLATSRSEIFDRQLLSRHMNRLVYENLSRGNASEYIHDEHIGEMKYISAYVPLMNSENKFLAYLNLPYFTQSGALTRDVTNLVVAVINVYMILLLVILLVSVVLADRITQPLRMIQNRIAQVSLSKKNEMIMYDRSDEIRGLVEEYNYMVKELERSAGLLAQSERESAWREMAKQIAHEIKNPLTPMKLNVQHLQRALGAGKNDPEMVERISATLIEQIDSLTAIANEFSDFAKMPRARKGRINLVTKLKSLLQLFESPDRFQITLDTGDHKRIFVYADKEQLMRVFINLVKNGIQSVPDGREGIIHISLEVVDDRRARVIFKDNGKGIPEEIRDKLFRPNFTTKSAGMGMGLAISYNIIRSFGGRIWYETVLNEGTTFFVELPVSVDKS